MEVPIGLIVMGGVVGLILKRGRGNARSDQQALESLRVLVEGKKHEARGRKAS